MVRCAVPGCKNDSRKQTKKDNNISFHRFPKSIELTNKWVEAIKRPNWEPNIRSFVCSVHFSISSFYETKGGLRRLVDGAEPRLEIEDGEEDSSDEMVEPSTSQPLNLSKNDLLVPVRSKKKALKEDVPERPTGRDSPKTCKLKHKIIYFYEIAKRRRLRSNHLYVQKNRFLKKIKLMTKMFTQLHEEKLLSHSVILDVCGTSAADLYKRLCHKKKT